MDNQINIQKENVLNAYKNGNQDLKALLENLFGKDMFQPKDIKERVKTFEDACGELGNEHPFVKSYEKYVNTASGEEDDVVAYLKLRIICAALNEGWEPEFVKDERRWAPWLVLYTNEEIERMDDDDREKICRVVGRSNDNAYAYGGLAFAYAVYASSDAHSYNAARLAFKTEALAKYAGTQFIEIYRDFIIAR